MNIPVSRTVKEVATGKPGEDRAEQPIEAYAEYSALVLLGEAGAGKSTEFRRAAKETKDGYYITARNFLALGIRPEWRNKTLFIDALDERRAGSQDQRTPLDEIRSRLDQLGQPKFRISCRSVDWLGLNDQRHLSEVSRDRKVKILHLNPLKDCDVMEILQRTDWIPAPKEFVRAAKEHGLGELLTNPLTLQLLAKSVVEQDWPRTRTEVFLRASRLLVSEQNEEHRLGARIPFSSEQKLHTAGRLFAVKILTGKDGYSISANHGGSCITINDAQVNDPHLSDTVLHSGLFKRGASGQHVAFHKAIAEFLAGMFLANEAGKGLPVGRVLSLMTGYDGVILAHFRGVAAWMATHSPKCRRQLVSADPIGAILDGDVATFPVDDRIHVLESINTKSKDNPWFILNVQSNDPRFGSLASADMAEYYARNLGSASRTDSYQVHAYFLLNVLKHGSPVSEMSDAVLRVAEDDTWWLRVRIEALRVLIGLSPTDARRHEILLNLSRRIDSGEVTDNDDEMQGFLLRDLYPDVIGPEQILDHLRSPKEPNLIGTYGAFWNRYITVQSTAPQLAVLMDRIADRFTEVLQIVRGSMIGANPLFDFVPSITTRAILESEGNVAPQRLFRWLEIFTHAELPVAQENRNQVRAWLSSRRGLHRQVFECCVDHCLEQANFAQCLSWMEYSLGLDSAPAYAQMCRAAAARIDSQEAALALKERASRYFRSDSSQISQGAMDLPPPASVGEQPAFGGHHQQGPSGLVQRHVGPVNSAERNRYEEFKAHETALRENRCDPWILFRLARIYFGEHPESSVGFPDTRLRTALFNDNKLVEAARLGLRNAVSHRDLPRVDEFARMFGKGQIHYLALPVLAGMEETALDGTVQFRSSGGLSKRLALTLHFGMPRMNPDPWRKNPLAADCPPAPPWYCRVARDEPALVAREFVRSARSRLRGGATLLPYVASLDSESHHSKTAPMMVAGLLRMFPSRSRNAELEVLASLLGLARQHCDEREFATVVENKLRSRSMAVAQRVYWLSAAFLAMPDTHRSAFADMLATNQLRIRHLAEFLWHSVERETPHNLFGHLSATDLEYLIRVVGSCYGPDRYRSASEDDRGATSVPRVEDFMKSLIEQLGNCTPREATEALERIRSDEALRPWRISLGHAADNQRAIRREAEFSYGSADAVCRVLSGGEPANPADLAALTADTLVKLAEEIRNGNTSDWKQYWTRAGHMSEWQPLNENDCRDVLLPRLKSNLPSLSFDCQREPNYLDSMRADIRVAFLGFGIPIEIKKSDHRSVWSSIQSQLIPKYTQDPECDGCGIYVVFWFGGEFLQPPPSGRKPSSSEQMREMLIASLEEDERRKIGVVVVDVSRNQSAAH